MPDDVKKKIRQKDLPESFSHQTGDTVRRIDANHQVIGVLYLEEQQLTMCTLHESMGQILAAKLPIFTELVRQAVGEIDILDELLVYRIETRDVELLVAPAQQCTACALHNKGRHAANKRF